LRPASRCGQAEGPRVARQEAQARRRAEGPSRRAAQERTGRAGV